MKPPSRSDESKSLRLMSALRSEAIPVLLLIVLWLAMFGGYLLDGDGMTPGIPAGDARTQWVAWREFGFGWMGAGVFPSWNPQVLCGVPFLASWQSALLYPPNLIFAALPIHHAARLSIFGHMAFAAVAAYALARYLGMSRLAGLAAAVGYSFAAPQLLRVFAGHWGAVCAIGWTPLILLGLESVIRKPTVGRAMLGGAAVAMQLLSGAPQYAAYAWLTALVYLIARLAFGDESGRKPVEATARAIVFSGFMFLFGLLLAAPQVLPAVAAMPSSARSIGVRPEWAAAFSLHPSKLVTLFAPGAFGDDATMPYWGAFNLWEMCGYVGVVIFALGAAGIFIGRGRMRKTLAVCAAVMLLFALGRHIPPVFALYRALPGMGGLRGTSKFLSGFSLLFCMLAGIGLDALVAADRRRLIRFAAVCGAAMVAVIVIALAPWENSETWHRMRDFFEMTRTETALPGDVSNDDAIRGAAAAFLRTALYLAALGGGAALFSRLRGSGGIRGMSLRGATVGGFVLILVGVEMAGFGWKYLRPEQGFDARAASLDAETAEFLRAESGNARVWIYGDPALNDPMREGLHTFEGIEPNPPLDFHRLFALAVRQPDDIAPSIYQATRFSPLWNLMAARYVVFPEPPATPPHGLKLVRDGARPVYENEAALPRAFIVHRHRISIHGEAPPQIHPEAVDYAREVIIHERPTQDVPMGAGEPTADSARIVSETPTRLVIEAELTEAGWLVLSDNYFPGWSAEVNGGAVQAHRANYAFRAVRLGPGAHRVVFRYRPPGLRSGLAASGLAILLALIRLVHPLLKIKRRAENG